MLIVPEEASLNRFEDGDLFYLDDVGVEELFDAMRQEIKQQIYC